jgi:4-hydroxybenzoate polyprenyltransferase
MGRKAKLIAYFRLLRLHAGASEAVLILLGALLMGLRDIFFSCILFFIGLFYHIYGYVLNDYADVDTDKTSLDLIKKPLVSGIISKNHALIISIGALIAAYVLVFLYFRVLIPLGFFTLAILLGGIYDIYGKKVPGFSDFIIAGSLMFAFFFGASTFSIDFSNVIFIVDLLIFFAIVFVNVVEGGLKDVDHDYLSGGKTLAIILGVRVVEGRLMITKKFVVVAYGLIAVCYGLLFLLFIQPGIDLFNNKFVQLTIVFVLLVVILLACYRFLHLSVFDRSKIKRHYAIINALAGVVLFIALYPLLGIEILVILLALPVTWYVVFNIVLYGKPLQPDV